MSAARAMMAVAVEMVAPAAKWSAPETGLPTLRKVRPAGVWRMASAHALSPGSRRERQSARTAAAP